MIQKKGQEKINVGNEVGRYGIVRYKDAGVFAGYVTKIESAGGSTTVYLREARWIYYWEGASTVLELAVHGTAKPDKCKFTVPIPEKIMFQVDDIFWATEKGRMSIINVPAWTQH